jgi:hypothetical protein
LYRRRRTWFRKLFSRPVSRPIKASPRRRLAVEALEDRVVPATYHVSSLLDDGSPGTLRDANPGADAIDFQVSGTVRLSGSELPAISDDLTITAPAAGLTVDAYGASRILEVNASVSVGLSGLTLVNGSADEGGGIFNNGTLSLTACTLSGNLARIGGGIFDNGGTLGLDRVTLDSNTARGANGANSNYDPGSPGQDAQGGALYNGGGAVTISDSTVTNNTARGGDGGWVLGRVVGTGQAGAGGGRLDVPGQPHGQQAPVPAQHRRPPAPQRAQPGAAVAVQQSVALGGHLVRGLLGQPALKPDEPGAGGVACVLQPVGQHQPRRVLAGRLLAPAQKRQQLGVRGGVSAHRPPSPWKRCRSPWKCWG